MPVARAVNRSRQPELRGIEVRHQARCSHPRSGRCSCSPSYRGTVFDASLGKYRKQRWTRNLPEARAWRLDTLRAVEKGTLGLPSAQTFRDAAEDFTAGMRSGAVLSRKRIAYKPATARSYKQSLDLHILPLVGGRRLVDLRRRDLQSAVDQLCLVHAPSTVRNAVNPVRAIYRHALERDLVTLNPTEGLKLPIVRTTRPRIVTPQEASRLIAAIKGQDAVIWATAFYAGLRLGEIRALTWSNVDLAADVIRVEHGWDQSDGEIDPKSDSGRRTVPIVPQLRERLTEHKLGAIRERVFPGVRAESFNPTGLATRTLKAWDAAGLERVGLHQARHCFASYLIAAGANAKQVQEKMGHSDIGTTYNLYGHLLPGDDDLIGRTLGAWLEQES